MRSDESSPEKIMFDPATMATSSLGIVKAVWYKRPWFLITVGLLLVAAISVITDISRPITKAQDAVTQNGTIKQINSDTKACVFGVTESFRFYNDFVQGKLTSSELSQAAKLVVDDQTACSFASEPIYDLTNNIQPLDTTAGKHIDSLLTISRQWMTDYALASIEDIQYLFTSPGDSAKIRNLSSLEVDLNADRISAMKEVHEAGQILGVSLVKPALPVLPHLVGI